MFPHPVLASEDDEEYVIRSIYGLPHMLDCFFTTIEMMCNSITPSVEYKTRADMLHLTIKQRLRVLGAVPERAYRQWDEATGKETVDKELPKLLHQLQHLFVDDKVDIDSQALLWQKRALALAKDCADHMEKCRVRFPFIMKLQRKVVTYGSSLFHLLLVFFALSVIFTGVVVVAVPALRPEIVVGLPLGCLACVLLIFSSLIIFAHFMVVSKALHFLHRELFHEYMVMGGAPSDLLLVMCGNAGFPTNLRSPNDLPRGYQRRTHRNQGVVINSSIFRESTDTVKTGAKLGIERGEQTKCGFYTIPYGSGVGYIACKQLDAQVVMIGFDSSFIITRWNNAAEVMTGFLQEGCVGKPLNELVQCPKDEDICDILRSSRKDKSIKIKLRSLTAAPTALTTVVAPITDAEGVQIGSMLICANSQDNLREYRLYMQNYHASESANLLTLLSERPSLQREDAMFVSAIQRFAARGVAGEIEARAREMESDWEWTNVEQILGRALGQGVGKHEVVVDPLFPPTLCVSPSMAKTIYTVLQLAGGTCTIALQMVNLTGNVFSLSVTVSLGPVCRPWDRDAVEERVVRLLHKSEGTAYILERRAMLHFPCQVASILDGDDDETEASPEHVQQLTQARTIVNCTVNVLTSITNMVDQHSLSLILLKTMFVSLASVRVRSDLEARLSATPCDVDVVICDGEWLSSSQDILLSGNHGAIVIPMVGAQVPVPKEFRYVIRMPLVRQDVLHLMLEVGKAVSMKKNAAAAKEERERILTLRQDSPWTRGKQLGRGSYGVVYEAVSDLTGGKMAVKMFYFSSDREESINTLLNEIKIMCSLNHPNIVHYFHCERKDNDVSLFMELCEASLTDIIVGRRQRPPHLTAIQIIRQVLTAIAYLHGRGIAHRDIKPQNILLKGDTVKLTDFGTAMQGSAAHEVRGTFRYMAPEVYRGEPHSFSCDIWSIGCLTCELFACPAPFMVQPSLLGELKSTEECLRNLPPNPTVIDFLEKCFQMDPEKRSGAYDLLLHPMLSGAATSAVEKMETVFDKKPEDIHNDPGHYNFSLKSA